MKYLLLVTIALFAITAQTASGMKQEFKVVPFDGAWNVTAGCAINCGGSDDIASDVQVALEPSDCTVSKGGEFTLTSSYSLSEEVTSGKANYRASLNGLPVINQNDDLCTDLKDGPTPCPLAKGPHKSKITKPLPDGVPAGTFVAQQSWTTDDGKPILCLKYRIIVQN
eukprot:g1481.t1